MKKVKIKKFLQNILLLSASLFFAVAITEIGVRLAKTELHPPKLFISQTEGAPYTLRPNFHGQTTTGILLNINSMGLRDKEYPLQPQQRQQNNIRIVVLGDSVTFGQAVRQEESYPEQLEAMFAAEKESEEKRETNKTVEVINAGVSGYGAHEEMLFLRETAIKYNPGIIIVGYALNDLGMVQPVLRGKNFKSRTIFKLKEFVKYNLWSYSWLTRKIQTLPYNIGLRNISINETEFTPKNPGWNITLEAMRGIKETADEHNARLVIVILPELRFINKTADAYRYAELHKRIAKEFRQIIPDVEVLDLLPAFEGYTRQEVTVSEKDAHPNRKGHELIATAIKDFLEEKGLIA